MGKAGPKIKIYMKKVVDKSDLFKLDDICNDNYYLGWDYKACYPLAAGEVVLLFKRIPKKEEPKPKKELPKPLRNGQIELPIKIEEEKKDG